ncbi:MAG: sn-glycerol-3-phosphate ABC transporter ATP-binding protein UgpC [Calditrichaeota bacterium]|nr:sn-glycerol-3-phosphate ABC transporter ATP-binding protein UgpC [Calditrichota bacterium]
MAFLSLKNLNKVYPNGFHAVQSADLEIAEGEFVVLVGPSGCGKSTTLRMIAGLEEVSSGEILIDGKVVNEMAPADRDIAMVFQNYALYPHMSNRENLAFGLRMRKMDPAEIERRIANVARSLSLEQLLDRRPRELSGGQRQRIALGRAIVRDPKVFLFDEPLSNLDAKLRVQMRTEIARLHKRLGTTMVYVTHDQVEAMTLGDRIVVMKDGVIQQVDTPMELYRNPSNRFVAGFIGSPAMNFFDGDGKDGVFESQGLRLQPPQGVPSQHLTLGIRPEDLLADGSGLPLGEWELDVVEHMGHETMAYFNLDPGQGVARLPADFGGQPGERVALSVREEAWYLFAPGPNGARINQDAKA